MFDARVDQYSLTIDASESLTDVMAQFDTDKGQAWADALYYVNHFNVSTFAMPVDTVITHEMFNPRRSADLPDAVIDLGYREHNAIETLFKAGYVADRYLESLWFDGNSETYASDHRSIDCVNVTRAFQTVTVEYSDYGYGPLSDGYARTWQVSDPKAVVEGFYIIAKYGCHVMRDHSVGYSETAPDFYDFAEAEGFDATRSTARCNVCHAYWSAESGSWHFNVDVHETERADAVAFDYDDATDFDGTSIACPMRGCDGRVGFNIY